jgi:Tfp pilus assembly protein PilP
MRHLLLVLAFVTIPVVAVAQAPASPSTPPAAAAAAQRPAQSVALEPQGYTYSPDGRRDPFVSLMRRGAEVGGSTPATRPAGLAGLTSGEVSLRGTLKGRDGFVGMLQGADNKTYLVRPGDRLLDGTVRSITADAVVIVQKVNDPLSLETEREVRKVLRQTEEAK